MTYIAGVLGIALLALLAVGSMYAGRAFQALVHRTLDLAERKVALQELRARSAAPPVIPPELMRRIMRWQDPAAQESERTMILSLYDEFRDSDNPWDVVKRHLPPEPDEQYNSPLLS